MNVIAGIFVGGRGTRMGGVAKGLLRAPDGTPIVVRTRQLLERAGASCVLIGIGGSGYDDLGLAMVPDDPDAQGPLAGLLALLELAHARAASCAIAVACDMPFLTEDLTRRLLEAPPAPIVAPRRDYWEPLFARYDASVLPVARAFARAGGRKLQTLLATAGAHPLGLTPEEEKALADWDLPGDMTRDTTSA